MSYLLNGTPQAAGNIVHNAFIQDQKKGEALVHEICDTILDVTKIDTWIGVVQWLKAIISEGGTFKEFVSKVESLDVSPFCGCVWTADFVAYRCRTCATSPCMSLCAACFERGNHAGHDFNMFRSEAGGACDCGDPSVMKEAGFCSQHGPKRQLSTPALHTFLSATKVVLDRIIFTLVLILRKASKQSSIEFSWSELPPSVKELFDFLLDLIKLGSPIQGHVSDCLLNEQLYSNLKNCVGYNCIEDLNSAMSLHHEESLKWFKESVNALKQPILPPGIKNTEQFDRSSKYNNYLDEITYWIVRLEFPENLILIVLNLLPDTRMKREFSKAFTRHYSRIALVLSSSLSVDQLSNRVVHISVQLFSNEDIAYMLTCDESLLQVFLVSLYNIVHPTLQQSTSSSADFHQFVSSNNSDMRANAYWPVVSDFVNVLGHNRVARYFLCDPDLISCWIQLLISFSGMDLIHRALDSHVEFEPNHMLLAFYMEREACASPLWCLLEVLLDASTAHISITIIHQLLDGLDELFEALGFVDYLPFDQVSFHYPLHRYLAHFICNAFNNQGVTLQDLNISKQQAVKLLAHPLQLLAAMNEIQNGMWVRNGMYIQTQALAYKQHFFCRFFIDADIFMLQVCAAILPPDNFVSSVFERFRVTQPLVSPNLPLHRGSPDADKQQKLLEAALRLIAFTIGSRHQLGMKAEDLIRCEVISLLGVRARTYSSLVENIPQCHECHQGLKGHLTDEIVKRVLTEYAVKREATDAMEQTTFMLKSSAWKLYDPIFSEHRYLYKRETHETHRNYCQNRLSDTTLSENLVESALWPPYQDIQDSSSHLHNFLDVLHCQSLHSFIYLILLKASQKDSLISETSLSLTLLLLKSALNIDKKLSEQSTLQRQAHVLNLWRESEDIVGKLMETVEMDLNAEKSTQFNLTGIRGMLPSFAEETKTSESMLCLLVKIYNNFSPSRFFSADQLSQVTVDSKMPPTAENVISSILCSAASKSEEVSLTIRVICKSLEPDITSDQLMAEDVTSSITEDLASRRRRQAKEARENMMKQFAKKQKQFLDKINMTSESNESLTSSTNDDESCHSFKCVICRGVETDSTSLPIGIICLVQSSSLLGKRTSVDTSPSYREANSTSSISYKSYAEEQRRWIDSTPYVCDVDVRAVVGSKGEGLHVSTCGHYVHNTCHSHYLRSLAPTDMFQLEDDTGCGFLCPMCRQMSNFLLPVSTAFVNECDTTTMTKLEQVVGRTSSDVEESRDPSRFYLSLLLFNLHHDFIQHDLKAVVRGVSSSDLTSSPHADKRLARRKIPIAEIFQLFHRCARNKRLSSVHEHDTRAYERLAVIDDDSALPDDVTPLLFCEPIALFLQLLVDCTVLCVEEFQVRVGSIFRLAVVQSLITIACRFSDGERTAWINMTSSSDDSSLLQRMIGHTIKSLPSQFYQPETTDMDSTVFTPQSVMTSVVTNLMELMWMMSLLQSHAFPEATAPFPQASSHQDNLFKSLAVYLGLRQSTTIDDDQLISYLTWDNHHIYITRWCNEISEVARSLPAVAREIVSQRMWFGPRLIDLPDEYSTFFQFNRQRMCTVCGSKARQPAVCLLCATLLCYKDRCGDAQMTGNAATRHARKCASGVGIFLLVNSSIVVVIRGKRACIWGTLYLDAHGEDDRGWKRGKPLFLKRARFDLLQKQLTHHAFDNSCKSWTPHQNLL